jgi:hypothetical protein
MAYAAVVGVRTYDSGGGKVFELSITETEASDTSKTSISAALESLPTQGRIVSQTFAIRSGDATNAAPQLAKKDAATLAPDIIVKAAPASDATTTPAPSVPYALYDGFFYHQANVDTGSNNAVFTQYLILAGIVGGGS